MNKVRSREDKEGVKKEDKSSFLWKHIALLGSPGSVPKAQLKVNFSY